ncbi:SAM-dependent methyltransferase [Micromonospora sp. MED01]|uniref:SAM-dependent methyltransferase n=1 Tax=Micromonospora alfalfae TaxID=2911212 RepID=UPI001EE8CDBD|nr:SAM-dependent methyltransferase [Micromonospora alfalfae]MCG5466659.1 SAM-dependent methyltransferase [Micromonospora alfalfae]
MTDQRTAAGGVDFGRATVARIYDYLLGGERNFPADRAAAHQLLQAVPEARDIAWSNRLFLRRAVHVLAEAGIRQFLDLGSGIPTQGNVHEVAQAIAPDSRVLYVDIDPVAVVASNEILMGGPHRALEGDFTQPELLLDTLSDSDLATVIDLNRPVAVLYCAVLQQVPDNRIDAVIAPIRDQLAPGSAMVISHLSAVDVTDAYDETTVSTAKSVFKAQAATEITLRTDAQLGALFGDFTIMAPGLVPLSDWRPELSGPDPYSTAPTRSPMHGAVAAR